MHNQALEGERAARERLVGEAAERDGAAAAARGQLATVTAERNSLSALVDSLKTQLAGKGTELAAQLTAAAGVAADGALAEARAREADRARSRLELEVAQLKQVGGRLVRGPRQTLGKLGCRHFYPSAVALNPITN
jgi:hypothetical protein